MNGEAVTTTFAVFHNESLFGNPLMFVTLYYSLGDGQHFQNAVAAALTTDSDRDTCTLYIYTCIHIHVHVYMEIYRYTHMYRHMNTT